MLDLCYLASIVNTIAADAKQLTILYPDYNFFLRHNSIVRPVFYRFVTLRERSKSTTFSATERGENIMVFDGIEPDSEVELLPKYNSSTFNVDKTNSLDIL